MPTMRDLPPADRSLRGRLANAKRWSVIRDLDDRRAVTEPARRARQAKLQPFIEAVAAAFPDLDAGAAERMARILARATHRSEAKAATSSAAFASPSLHQPGHFDD